MITCSRCGEVMTHDVRNVTFITEDGIEVLLIGAPVLVCSHHEEEARLTEEAQAILERALKEKRQWPDSPPMLTIHMPFLLSETDEATEEPHARG